MIQHVHCYHWGPFPSQLISQMLQDLFQSAVRLFPQPMLLPSQKSKAAIWPGHWQCMGPNNTTAFPCKHISSFSLQGKRRKTKKTCQVNPVQLSALLFKGHISINPQKKRFGNNVEIVKLLTLQRNIPSAQTHRRIFIALYLFNILKHSF